jgi:polyisoprenoid-binding protein YceI
MRNLLLLSAMLAMTPFSAFAQMTPPAEMPSGIYKLDKSHASVTWKVSHLGLSNYTARFASLDAELNFDAAKPENSSVKATIDTSSIRTDFPATPEKDFDKKLSGDADWFNGTKFPTITFESTKVEKTGDTTAKIHGNLTMLGVTKPMTLDAVFNGAYLKKPFADVPGIGFSAKGLINRSDWGFSTYVPNIGDQVEILIEAEFHQAP